MSGRKTPRFTPSFILGVLAVPLSAVVAYALVGTSTDSASDGAATTVAEATTIATTSTTTTMLPPAAEEEAEEEVRDVAADLVMACGIDGQDLVDREAADEISSLERAALDALRPICEGAGLALAGPPAPPPVIRRVTVTTPPVAGGDATAAQGEDPDGKDENDDSEEKDEDDDHGSVSDYEAAQARAQTAIDLAVSQDGDEEKIAEAGRKLGEAAKKAAKGEYGEAEQKAREAEKKAKDAVEDDD